MALNTADRKSVKGAERKAREVDRARGEIVANLMSTSAGREWIWNILESSNIWATTFNDSPMRSSYLEGRRSLGLELLDSVIRFAPDLFIQAMREANVRRSLDASDTAPDSGESPSAEHPGSPEPGRLDQESAGPNIDPATGEVRYDA